MTKRESILIHDFNKQSRNINKKRSHLTLSPPGWAISHPRLFPRPRLQSQCDLCGLKRKPTWCTTCAICACSAARVWAERTTVSPCVHCFLSHFLPVHPVRLFPLKARPRLLWPTPRPLSAPPCPALVWRGGSGTMWWPARWLTLTAARPGPGPREINTSDAKNVSPARRSGGVWTQSWTFCAFSGCSVGQRHWVHLYLQNIHRQKKKNHIKLHVEQHLIPGSLVVGRKAEWKTYSNLLHS